MKKTLKVFAFVALVLALLAGPPQTFAQTNVTRTTAAAAQAAGAAANQLVVTATTGMTASTASTETFLLIGRELEKLVAINGTTLTVRRAQSGTLAAGHRSGEQVIFGSGGTFNPNAGTTSGVFLGGSSASPSGTCTRTSQQYLPVFGIMSGYNNGFAYDCLGGKWVQGTLPDAPDPSAITLACTIPIGSVAYGSLGTSTADVADKRFLSSIYVPKTAWITGIKVLSGATSTTDNIHAAIYDSTGHVIAHSAAAGALLATADSFQTEAFTAAQFLVGPARYFIGVTGNGSAAGAIRTIAASTFVDVITTSKTSVTFGTFPDIAAADIPTTFTATVGPIGCLYY